jgi:hypothetical protein
MLSIRQDQEENQNVAQAPTLGRTAGSISQGGGGGQRRNVSQRGSGFTNLQQYVTANENNANPEIVRQRTAQAGTGLQQAQTGFENVAQQARTGLQGIQGVNTFVGNVLRDPTAAVANPANLQRFQALRTGTEKIQNPTEVFQPFSQARSGFESQREQLAGGLRRDVTGSGLQDYIRSQRANPSLATQGENVLDRFLTESTTAGKTALQQAQERAGQIQATQIPGISAEVEALRQQVEPLQFRTQQGIQSGINPLVKEQENFITGLNKNYVAQQLGLNVGDAQYISDQINKSKSNQLNLQNSINTNNREIDNLNTAIRNEQSTINTLNNQIKEQEDLRDRVGARSFNPDRLKFLERSKTETQNQIDRLTGDVQSRNSSNQKFNFDLNSQTNWYNDYLARNQDTLNKFNEYNQNRTREELLRAYDPNRLARVQALQSLSGLDLSSLLSQGVS